MKAPPHASFSLKLHARTFVTARQILGHYCCEPRITRYARLVELAGDTIGIAALKVLRDKNKEYLKFLLGEIRSNTDMRVIFTADDGQAYTITLEPKSGTLQIAKKA